MELTDRQELRILSKIRPRANSTCCEWYGTKGAEGNNIVSINGKTRAANRIIYEIKVGPIEGKQFVRMTCGDYECCNFEHMKLSPAPHDKLPTLRPEDYQNPKTITAFGETKSIAEWVKDERCVVSRPALYGRLMLQRSGRNNWTNEAILTEPAHKRLTNEEAEQRRMDSGLVAKRLIRMGRAHEIPIGARLPDGTIKQAPKWEEE